MNFNRQQLWINSEVLDLFIHYVSSALGDICSMDFSVLIFALSLLLCLLTVVEYWIAWYLFLGTDLSSSETIFRWKLRFFGTKLIIKITFTIHLFKSYTFTRNMRKLKWVRKLKQWTTKQVTKTYHEYLHFVCFTRRVRFVVFYWGASNAFYWGASDSMIYWITVLMVMTSV